MEQGSAGHDLVGRETELAAVRRWTDMLSTGPAGLLVRGEAGIGKTSVWSAALDLARQRGARVLVSRPVEGELALGYAGLGDLLLGDTDALIAVLPGPQARALEAALSLDAGPEPVNPLLIGRAVQEVLRHLAAHGPLVVAIDDVQWLDAPSSRALAFAARRLGGAPIGFALTLRDDHDDPLHIVAALGDGAADLRLGGLSLGAIGHVLRARTDPAIARRRIMAIHERSRGNPFFALELARLGSASDGLPPTLRELADSRLHAMTDGAREAAELVAIRGPLPITAFADPTALDAAVTAGVLVEQSGEVRFSHPLLAAGTYERIPPARRRELHRRASAAAGSLEERARHLALASTEPATHAADLLDAAARAARARGAPDTAADLAAHAHRLTPREHVQDRERRLMDRAEYLYLAADEAAAGGLVTEILAGPAEGAVRVRALVQRALTVLDPREAVGSLELAVAIQHDDAILATRALSQLAWQRGAWLGDVEPAIGEAMAALQRAEVLDDERLLSTALTTAGLLLSIVGRAGAAEHFERAVALLGTAQVAPGDHTPHIAFAHERFWRGDFETAEALLAAEHQRATDEGDDGLIARLKVFGGDFAMRRGRWDEAARLLEEALIDASDYWRITALVRRAILRARRGNPEAGRDADEVRSSPVARTDPSMAAAADFATGLLEHASGRTDRAADLVERLAGPEARTGSRTAEFSGTIPETAAVLVEAGRLRKAELLADDLAERRAQLAPWGDAAEAYVRGLVAHADGRSEDALRQLAAAHHGFASLPAP